VPYFEKRLYELSDHDVTPERLVALASEVEIDIQGTHSSSSGVVVYSGSCSSSVCTGCCVCLIYLCDCAIMEWAYYLCCFDPACSVRMHASDSIS
jgi:hypothetical protein